MKSRFQVLRGGRAVRVIALMMSRVMAPRTILPSETPTGVSDSNPIFMKAKEPPQMRASSR
jgi:hypothetical protein